MKTLYVYEPHVCGTTTYQPGDTRELDENDAKQLVELKVLGDKPIEKPKAPHDYVRDSLGKLELKKAGKNRLLVIAAYEQATVPQGDEATEAELIAAITAKRAIV